MFVMMIYHSTQTKFSKSGNMEQHNNEATGFYVESAQSTVSKTTRCFYFSYNSMARLWHAHTTKQHVRFLTSREATVYWYCRIIQANFYTLLLHCIFSLASSLPFIILHRGLPVEQHVVLQTHSKVTLLRNQSHTQSQSPHHHHYHTFCIKTT